MVIFGTQIVALITPIIATVSFIISEKILHIETFTVLFYMMPIIYFFAILLANISLGVVSANSVNFITKKLDVNIFAVILYKDFIFWMGRSFTLFVLGIMWLFLDDNTLVTKSAILLAIVLSIVTWYFSKKVNQSLTY